MTESHDIPSDFTSQISDAFKEIGQTYISGSFGMVYRCTIGTSEGTVDVAVKVFKIDPGRAVEKHEKAIRRELKVWLRLSKHQTIVPLLGIAHVDRNEHGTTSCSDTTGLPDGHLPRRNKTVVIFGQSGAGKSSLVNLMAGKEVATTSPDMQRCTMQWKDYTINFGGESYIVFDTIGFEEPQLGTRGYLESVKNAYQLIKKLDSRGGVDLLLYCVRAGQISAVLQSNYWLFHEVICEKKVPIVLAITNLEREEKMENWWERNKWTFDKYQIQVDGHACITAANRLDGRHKTLYEESRITIRNLVRQFTADGQKQAWIGGDDLFVSLMRKLKELLLVGSHVRRKDLIPHLTMHCGVSPEVAKQLANMIRKT
ncbi:hypothetical protein BDR05DRAFT_964174 [Suillus weaverae]|nr:hypothetical protein BDR05DRAFT_964174 [Suillus weaverae]